MTNDERIMREDNMASWRLATLLALNGFLLTVVFSDFVPTTSSAALGICLLPIIGLLISASTLAVSLLSVYVKLEVHRDWLRSGAPSLYRDTSAFRFVVFQILGPYVLSSLLFTSFWIVFVCAK